MSSFFLFLIRLYRRFLSPFLPQACRFTPTCSEYAQEAFEQKGVLQAVWMTTLRVAKCHPFHPGGYDPVNPVRKQGSQTGADVAPSLPSPVHEERSNA